MTEETRRSCFPVFLLHPGEKVVTALILGLLLLRLVFLGRPDLFPEEAYYWNYARHLDIGYLDHPPMVAWLIFAGTKVFGHHEFGVRIGAFLCSLVTSVFVFRLTDLLYGRKPAVTAVLLAQVLPFYFLTGFMITPDSPLTACWAGMLYYLARVFFAGKARAWLGVGVCLGLGMLSKYTIALLGPATLLFMLLDPASRVWFRRSAPYLAVGLSVLIFSPVLWWNKEHAWASFAFQGKQRIVERRRFSLHELLASMFGILTPVGVWVGAGLLFFQRVESEQKRRVLFARVFTLVPLSVFFFFSLTHRVKLNWTGPIWLALLPGLAASLCLLSPSYRPWLRTGWRVSVALLVACYCLFLAYLSHGLPGVGYARNMELLPVGWRELGRELEAQKRDLEQSSGGKVMLVGMDRNFIASEAAFYHSDQAKAVAETTGAHLFDGRALMYEFWRPAKMEDGATLLLASFEKVTLNSGPIRKRSSSLGEIEERWLTRGGKRIRPYYTRVAFGYRAVGEGEK